MDIYLRQNFKGQRTGVSIPIHSGTSPTSQHANQSLQKSFRLSHADKIETVYGSRTQIKINKEVSN